MYLPTIYYCIHMYTNIYDVIYVNNVQSLVCSMYASKKTASISIPQFTHKMLRQSFHLKLYYVSGTYFFYTFLLVNKQ